jgi:hypothetical protein
LDFRRLAERLIHDAVTLRQLQQRRNLLGGGIGIERDIQPDRAEADTRVLRHTKRPAKIQIAFGRDRRVAQLDADCRRHSVQCHTGARHERFEQHVARAGQRAIAARRRVQPCFHQRTPGLDAARDTVRRTTRRTQRNHRRRGL